MQFNLRIKILLIISIVLLITIGTTNVANSINYRNHYFSVLKANAFTIGKELKVPLDRYLAQGLSINGMLDYDIQCRKLVKEYPMIAFVSVCDMNGLIIYQIDTTFGETSRVNKKVLDAMKMGEENVVEYRERNVVHYGFVIPVGETGKKQGAIVLGLPKKAIDDKLRAPFWLSITISFCVFIVTIVLISYAINRWVTKPLQALDRVTQKIIRDGIESGVKIEITSQDEIGRLGLSFNRMSEALQKTTVSKVYVDRVIASITDGLFVIDHDYKVLSVNEAAVQITGYVENEIINQPVQKFFCPGQTIPFMDKNNSEFQQKGIVHNSESVFVRKDGTKIPVLLSCSRMDDYSGNVNRIVITIKDITERKLIEDALITQTRRLTQSNAQLKEFVYIASHDLQEPLRKVCAFSERITNKYASVLDETGKDYLNRIVNAGVRMQTLINDLLSYSWVSTKTQTFDTVDLNRIGEEVVSDLQIRIEQTAGRIEIAQLPLIEAEPTQIRQVFQNIIGNALKFHRKDVAPYIKVYASVRNQKNEKSWENEDLFCDLTFEDNGIGIDQQYYQRIFGVFQRLHGKDEYEGTGVGLAICQKIIQRHNGEIRVESVVGVGTKFILSLPVKQKKHGDGKGENRDDQ
ncbi:MAG: sensor histidine kinase [Fibrobacterota bacterium]|nr:ATP-binding protein [Chitinispirillaceae bacterium]